MSNYITVNIEPFVIGCRIVSFRSEQQYDGTWIITYELETS